jgi:phosphate butyryltransferase
MTFKEIMEQAKKIQTQTLVIAAAEEIHVIRSIKPILDIINVVLVGQEKIINNLLKTEDIFHDSIRIINATDDIDAAIQAVKLVHDHPSYFLMKGRCSTSVILHEALNKEYGLRTGSRLSHVSLMDIPAYHKPIFMTDGAMNIAPNKEEKVALIENLRPLMNLVGIQKAKVALISAVEKPTEAMQSTMDALYVKEAFKNDQDFDVDGPFALDNAINLEASKQKGIRSDVTGDADVLLMPQIESGNVFYKSMMFLAGAKSASLILGASAPIVITSRADASDTKTYSILLSALYNSKYGGR